VADAHVGAQTEQHEQQPPAEHRPVGDLPGGDRGELLGEAGVEVGLLEDV